MVLGHGRARHELPGQPMMNKPPVAGDSRGWRDPREDPRGAVSPR